MSGTTKVREHNWESASGTHRSLVRQLAAAGATEPGEDAAGTGSGPFSVVLVFDSQGRRDFVRRRLAEQNVSAEIGPRDETGASEEDRQLRGRLLFVRCDSAQGQSNLARAAAIAEEANRQYETLGTADEKSPDSPDAREQPQRTIEDQHDYWPHFISAQSSPVWGHRYGNRRRMKDEG
jgi:hypothetical protein